MFYIKILLFLLFFPLLSFSNQDIIVPTSNEVMPLKKIEIGMRGFFYSKTLKNNFKKYEVEILGLSKSIFPTSKPIIIANFIGMKDTGILQGMSGSPVFINNKLIGAVAFGPRFSNSSIIIGGIQPIEYMLKMLEESKKTKNIKPLSSLPLSQTFGHFNFNLKKISNNFYKKYNPFYKKLVGFYVQNHNNHRKNSLFKIVSNFFSLFYPKTKLTLEISSNEESIYLNYLKKYEKQINITPNPGAHVSILLLSGDLKFGVSGTITYRDDKNILLFGHGYNGFLPNKLSLPIYNAFVISEYVSSDASLISESIGKPIGSVVTSNSYGVHAILNQHDYLSIPFNVSLKDDFKFIFNKKYFIHSMEVFDMITSIALSESFYAHNIYSSPNSFTLDVNFSIKVKNLKSQRKDILKVRNVYSQNINIKSPYSSNLVKIHKDLSIILFLLAHNPFAKVQILSIDININIIRSNKIITIKRVEASKKKVKLGEKITLKFFLSNFKKNIHIKTIPFKLPEDISGIRKGDVITLKIQNAYTYFINNSDLFSMMYNIRDYDFSYFNQTINSYSKFIDLLKKSIFNKYVLILTIDTNKNEKLYQFNGTSVPNIPKSIFPIIYKSYPNMIENLYQRKVYFLTDHLIKGKFSFNLSIDS